MVGGLGMARAAHVVGEKVRERRRVVKRVSMVDWGACLWLSFVRFVEWFRRRFTIAKESHVHESYVERGLHYSRKKQIQQRIQLTPLRVHHHS